MLQVRLGMAKVAKAIVQPTTNEAHAERQATQVEREMPQVKRPAIQLKIWQAQVEQRAAQLNLSMRRLKPEEGQMAQVAKHDCKER